MYKRESLTAALLEHQIISSRILFLIEFHFCICFRSTVKIRRDAASFMIDCGDNLTCNADISIQGSSVVSQTR